MGLLRYNWRTFQLELIYLNLIYIVEDDEGIRELVTYALKKEGYEVVGYEIGKEVFEQKPPDLYILDIMLPGEDGYTILKKIRTMASTKDIPVIMLTSKTSEYDKVKALDMGADDYIEKPFGVMELISRVKAVLRRYVGINKNSVLNSGNLTLDVEKHEVRVNDKEVYLTLKEFDLLYYLMKNMNIVLSRDQIMNEVWGFDFEGETRTVDVHIRTLRMKLGEAGESIQTVRGVGYKFGG